MVQEQSYPEAEERLCICDLCQYLLHLYRHTQNYAQRALDQNQQLIDCGIRRFRELVRARR